MPAGKGNIYMLPQRMPTEIRDKQSNVYDYIDADKMDKEGKNIQVKPEGQQNTNDYGYLEPVSFKPEAQYTDFETSTGQEANDYLEVIPTDTFTNAAHANVQ